MLPIQFEGSRWIGKPPSMTDEQCFGIPASSGIIPQPVKFYGVPTYHYIDQSEFPQWITAWKPNKEDLEALNRGEPIYIRSLSDFLVPMGVYTINEKGEINE